MNLLHLIKIKWNFETSKSASYVENEKYAYRKLAMICFMFNIIYDKFRFAVVHCNSM